MHAPTPSIKVTVNHPGEDSLDCFVHDEPSATRLALWLIKLAPDTKVTVFAPNDPPEYVVDYCQSMPLHRDDLVVSDAVVQTLTLPAFQCAVPVFTKMSALSKDG